MNANLDKRIFKQVRNANLRYNLIENNDRIAVGMSGGKDSMALLYYLNLLNKYTPLKFSLVPIYLDLGWNNDITALHDFCSKLNLPLKVETTDIAKIVFDIRKETNPCSLCSNLRRGALNRISKNLECNKVALGHHRDDVVNTLMMSIIHEGRFHVFKPITYLDRIDLHIIRPMVYVEEKEIISFIDTNNISTVKNLCPSDGLTKRSEVKNLLIQLSEQFPDLKRKILSSIENADAGSFWG